MVPVSRQHPARMGFCLTGCSYALDQKALYGIRSPVARIQAVEVGLASLTVTLNKPLADFLLPVLATLNSAGLEILISKRRTLPPWDRQ